MTPDLTRHYRATLGHVYWIGGPPDAGKTTVATMVAAAMNGTSYHQDRHEREHIQRADPALHPRHTTLRERLVHQTEAEFFEESWLGRPIDEMARQSRLTWEERIDLICEDLLALPADRPIVAEGPGFFPNVIVPLLVRPTQAMWLIPTERFKRDSHRRRDKSAWNTLTSNPGAARRNHIARDLFLANAYRVDLANAGLPWIDVDGSEPPEAVAQRLVACFQGPPGEAIQAPDWTV